MNTLHLSLLALLCTAACVAPSGSANPEGTDGQSATTGDTGSESGGTTSGGNSNATGGSNTGGLSTGATGSGGTENGGSQGEACGGPPGTAPSGELSATQIAAANAESNTSYHLLEGPVWLDGALYYSHFSNAGANWPSQIKRLNPDGSVEVLVESSGSNGLAVDHAGNLIAATHDNKEISQFDASTLARTTVIGDYLDNPLNAPNDVVVAESGDIFFTDPDSDQKNAAPGGQDSARVYRWDGTTLSVVDDSFKPNGIALSPDGEFLYVSGGGYSGKLVRYRLVDGIPTPGEDVMPLTEPDGMTFDCLGNLYVTEHASMSNRSRVRVFDPEGTEISTIIIGPATGVGYSDVEAKATNVTFGGPERKTLFITATYSLWRIQLDVQGLHY